MTYNFLTVGLQNVLLLLAILEGLSIPTFMCFFLRPVLRIASCVGPNFVNFFINFVNVFISISLLELKLSHKDIKIRLMSTQYYMKE